METSTSGSSSSTPDSSTVHSGDNSSPVKNTQPSAALTPLPKVLDQAAVQDGVRRVLENSFGLKVAGGVTCPDHQPVQVGFTFNCKATVNAKQKTITVTVRTAEGEYEVAAP